MTWDEARIRDLEALVEQMRNEMTLMAREIELVKNEGCWRYHQDPEHKHR